MSTVTATETDRYFERDAKPHPVADSIAARLGEMGDFIAVTYDGRPSYSSYDGPPEECLGVYLRGPDWNKPGDEFFRRGDWEDGGSVTAEAGEAERQIVETLREKAAHYARLAQKAAEALGVPSPIATCWAGVFDGRDGKRFRSHVEEGKAGAETYTGLMGKFGHECKLVEMLAVEME